MENRRVSKHFYCYVCKKDFKLLVDPERLEEVSCPTCNQRFVVLAPNVPPKPAEPIPPPQPQPTDPNFREYSGPQQDPGYFHGSRPSVPVQEPMYDGYPSFQQPHPVPEPEYEDGEEAGYSPEQAGPYGEEMKSSAQFYGEPQTMFFPSATANIQISGSMPGGFHISFGGGEPEVRRTVGRRLPGDPRLGRGHHHQTHMMETGFPPMPFPMGMPAFPNMNNLFGNLGFPGLHFNDFFGQDNMFSIDPDFDAEDFGINFSSNFIPAGGDIDLAEALSFQQEQPTGNPPASKRAVTRLPIFALEEKHCKKGADGKLEFPACTICCSNIGLGEKAQLLPCGHMYHPDCIKPWFDQNNTCPTCRYELPTDDVGYEEERRRNAASRRQQRRQQRESTRVPPRVHVRPAPRRVPAPVPPRASAPAPAAGHQHHYVHRFSGGPSRGRGHGFDKGGFK